MATSSECGRRDDGGGVGKRQQRLDIGSAAAGELDRQFVDDLLARALNLRGDPPTGVMKPEHTYRDLFDDEPCPITSLDVQQFMAEYGLLNFARLTTQSFRKHD